MNVLSKILGTATELKAQVKIRLTSTPAIQDAAMFGAADAKKDGVLTKDEWAKAGFGMDRFVAHDANKDGQVSAKEFQAARQHEREFAALDRNGDGKLSASELPGTILGCIANFARFRKLDANHDGAISQAEFVQGRRAEETPHVFWPIQR